MMIIASLTRHEDIGLAAAEEPDLIEMRLDLMGGDPGAALMAARDQTSLPVIGTLRSRQEGGRFDGDPDEWMEIMEPLLPLADIIDVEGRYREHAPAISGAGKRIIASCHMPHMPSYESLMDTEKDLRTFGDIPKIIVTPARPEDVITLARFTQAAGRPICTGVNGRAYRYARAILPFFGSDYSYCHTGIPAAEGQYSVAEFKTLMRLLG